MTEKITAHPLITVIDREITDIPENETVIIATGPLTSGGLAESIRKSAGIISAF